MPGDCFGPVKSARIGLRTIGRPFRGAGARGFNFSDVPGTICGERTVLESGFSTLVFDSGAGRRTAFDISDTSGSCIGIADIVFVRFGARRGTKSRLSVAFWVRGILAGAGVTLEELRAFSEPKLPYNELGLAIGPVRSLCSVPTVLPFLTGLGLAETIRAAIIEDVLSCSPEAGAFDADAAERAPASITSWGFKCRPREGDLLTSLLIVAPS